MVYYAIEPPTLWGNIKSKPYITVSAKGLSNGLSDIPNDGADFGPDTPGTQTSGILEAVRYSYGSLNSPNIPIKLLPGRFIISPNATLYLVNSKQPYTGVPEYAIIPIPTVVFNGGSNSSIQNISIHGSGALFNSGGTGNNNTGLINSSGMTIIDVSNVSAPSGATVMTFAWDRSVNTNGTNAIDIGDFVIFQGVPQASGDNIVGGVDFNYSYDAKATNISIYSPNNFQTTVFPSSYEIGFMIDGYVGNECWVDEVSVYANYTGALFGPHCHVGTYTSQSNYIGLVPYGDDGPVIGRYDVQGCIYNIYVSSNYSGNARIFLLQGEDYSAASSSYNQTAADVYIASGSYSGSYFTTSIENFFMRYSYGSPNPRLPVVQTNGTAYNVIIKRIESQPSAINGTTAGTIQPYVIEYGTNYKKIMFQFNGYENNTTTDQTVSYPSNSAPQSNSLNFSSYAVITGNNTGLTISASTTGITITSPNSTTTYSGIVIVEGY